MGESLFKKLVKEVVATVQDLFVTALVLVILVFMAGQFYGVAYSRVEAFWYPAWVLAVVLVYKLLKDMFHKEKKKEK
jgi:hypothetical protein